MPRIAGVDVKALLIFLPRRLLNSFKPGASFSKSTVGSDESLENYYAKEDDVVGWKSKILRISLPYW